MYSYKKTPGSPLSFTDNTTPLDIFCHFFTDEVWDLLVTETNRYAQQKLASLGNTRTWAETNVEEMKAFIGMLIALGILQLLRLEMFWQQKYSFLATPGISDIMTKTKFEQIYRFFHLADSSQAVPTGEPGHDKLYKIRRLLDILTSKFE